MAELHITTVEELENFRKYGLGNETDGVQWGTEALIVYLDENLDYTGVETEIYIQSAPGIIIDFKGQGHSISNISLETADQNSTNSFLGQMNSIDDIKLIDIKMVGGYNISPFYSITTLTNIIITGFLSGLSVHYICYDYKDITKAMFSGTLIGTTQVSLGSFRANAKIQQIVLNTVNGVVSSPIIKPFGHYFYNDAVGSSQESFFIGNIDGNMINTGQFQIPQTDTFIYVYIINEEEVYNKVQERGLVATNIVDSTNYNINTMLQNRHYYINTSVEHILCDTTKWPTITVEEAEDINTWRKIGWPI